MSAKTKRLRKRNDWTNESPENFRARIALDFIALLEDRMEALPMKKKELAEKLDVTQAAVSQKLNNPYNLELKTIVDYARTVGLKVAIVPYDDGDPDNTNGPVNGELFALAWNLVGKPLNYRDWKRIERLANLDAKESPPTLDATETQHENSTLAVNGDPERI